MENIFKGAYFGKLYKNRDEKKAIYWKHNYRHHLFTDTERGPIECENNGKLYRFLDKDTQFDIVGK